MLLVMMSWEIKANVQSQPSPKYEITEGKISDFINNYDNKTIKGLEIIRKGDAYVDVFIDRKQKIIASYDFLYLREAKVSAEDVERLVKTALGWSCIQEIWIDVCVIDGNLNFKQTNFTKRITFAGTVFTAAPYFDDAKFGAEVRFTNAVFEGGAYFHRTEFSSEASFEGATFSSTEANFEFPIFSNQANFGFALFSGQADFRRNKFDVKAIFDDAEFSEVDFSSSTFLKGAQFLRARFDKRADFESVEFSGERAEFIEAVFLEETNFDAATMEKTVDFYRARFLRDLYLDHTTFTAGIILTVTIFSRIYVNFPDDADKVLEFLHSPDSTEILDGKEIYLSLVNTYLRLIKNQKDLGRPYDSLYLAMKRLQRQKKTPINQLIEWALFDLTTKYGTEQFPPKGVLLYIGIVLGFFTGFYYIFYFRGIDFLDYYNPNGEKEEAPRAIRKMDVIWFSIDTFIPGIEFINVRPWKITDRTWIEKPFRIRYSTIATIERLLGWLLVPILLRYFRL